MLGITQNPSMRIVAKGLLCVRVAISLLLGTLVLAGTARAAGQTSEQTQEVVPPVGQTSEQTQEVVPPVGQTSEQTQEVVPPVGQTSEQTQEVVPPVGQTSEQTQEVVPPVGQTSEQTQEVVPPVGQTSEQTQEVVPPVGQTSERTQEVAPTEPTNGQVAGSLPPSPPSAPQDAATAVEPSGPAAAGVSSALIVSLTTGPAAGDPREPPATRAASLASIGAPAWLTPAQLAGDLSCELSELAEPVTDNCTGWLGGQSFLSASPRDFATRAAAKTGAPAGGGSGGSGAGSRSVIPPTGPAPSGAFGGSATGGSGVALSGFLTLAGLLLLAAPCAMRRLRLSCQPWLTAFFVLIPERPG